MNTKFSQITVSPNNLASNDHLLGVTAANADVLFTPAQVAAGTGAGLTIGSTTVTGGTDNQALTVGGGTLGETPIRTLLTANANYYVAVTGNDSNDGSIGSPWATPQHAANVFGQTLDFAGFTVTSNIGVGTFSGPLLPTFVGGGILRWEGAGAASTTFIIPSSANPFCFNCSSTVGNTTVSLNNVTLDGSQSVGGTTAHGLFSAEGAGQTFFLGTFNGSGGSIVLKPGDATTANGCITAEGQIVIFITSGSMTVDGSGTVNGIPTIFATQGGLFGAKFRHWN